MQVVGVVRDAVYESLRQTPPPTVYGAYLQGRPDTATLEIHAPRVLHRWLLRFGARSNRSWLASRYASGH